jgi:hypothetical protein
MKKIVGIGIFVCLLFLIGFFVGLNWSKKSPENSPAIIDIVNPVPDTVFKPVIKYVGVPEYRDTGTFQKILIHDTIPLTIPIDTVSIVKDYMLQRNYSLDTTINEIHAISKSEVFANRLLTYHLELTNLRPIASEKRWGVRGGLILGKKEITPTLGLDYQRWGVSAGYNLSTRNSAVGLFYRIK